MSDIADDADRQVDQFLQYAVSHKRPEGPPFTGLCANCGEPVVEPKRWCDVVCRDEEQKRAGRMYGDK
jgi:hypothetical protein